MSTRQPPLLRAPARPIPPSVQRWTRNPRLRCEIPATNTPKQTARPAGGEGRRQSTILRMVPLPLQGRNECRLDSHPFSAPLRAPSRCRVDIHSSPARGGGPSEGWWRGITACCRGPPSQTTPPPSFGWSPSPCRGGMNVDSTATPSPRPCAPHPPCRGGIGEMYRPPPLYTLARQITVAGTTTTGSRSPDWGNARSPSRAMRPRSAWNRCSGPRWKRRQWRTPCPSCSMIVPPSCSASMIVTARA
jgi:hypothetical protein